MTLLRALAGLALGMVVFAGLIYFLVVVNFSQRLEDPEVYNVAISDTDAYNRIYDEVLVDPALEDQTGDLLGDLQFHERDEAVEVLKGVMPPAYLQEQTEDNIGRFTGFLRHELDDLEIFVNLKEPLERVEPVVLKEANEIIDQIEVQPPASSECSREALSKLAGALAELAARFSDGRFPESAPSLEALTRECRQRGFDRWFDAFLDDPAMNSQAALVLDASREEIRSSFIEGDTRAFLKAVALPLVTSLIEDSVADVRRELQRGDRFDVLEWLAEESEDLTRDDIEEQAEALRDVVSAANGPGRIISLVMVIVGSLLMAAVHIPKPSEVLRWPGLSLLMGGGVCLAIGFVVNSAVPGQIGEAIADVSSYSHDVPVSAVRLAGDLAESFAQQATAGFIPSAVAVMVIGGVLLAASFVAEVLWALLSRILPGRGDGRRGR